MSKLYPCVNCTEDGYCKKYSDEEVKTWCVQGPCKDERPSNADRFRAMTDEELAKYFSYIADCDNCPNELDRECCVNEDACINKWMKWLKREAET